MAWIDRWFRHAVAWWGARPDVAGVQLAAALDWYAQVRPLVDGRAGGLMLLDGRPDHVVVGADHRVTLIDVADLQAGDPVMDLAVLELDAPGILRGVVSAWSHPEVAAGHLDQLLPFYVFLRALAAAEWEVRVAGDAGRAERSLRVAHSSLAAEHQVGRVVRGPRARRPTT